MPPKCVRLAHRNEPYLSYSRTSVTVSNELKIAVDRLHPNGLEVALHRSHMGRVFVDGVAVNFDDSTLMVELEDTEFSEDGSPDVFVDKPGSNFKLLGEELHRSVAIGEADKRELAVSPRYGATVQGKGLWQTAPDLGSMDRPRGSLAELGIAVVTVVEAFELG